MSTTTTTTFPPYTHPQWIEPYFDPTTPRNVTALMGKSAYLSCRVRNLGNKTVSWIRHRDIHILTVGSYTYTSDLRFQATHHHDSDDWTLQIKWTQKRDAGMYECQISTQPVRSYFVNLNVVVPTATILGGPDLHVDKGSTINLTCTVKFSPEPPAYIFWYHHEEVINYDSSRGGVSVITEKGDVTTSFLLIQNADLADSGKYSCAPSNADVASVRVHVLNVRPIISGEHPEAMQTGSSGCQYSWLTILMLMTMIFYYNQQYISCNLTNCLLKTTCHLTYNTSDTKSTTSSSSTRSSTTCFTSASSCSSTLTTVMAKPTATITTTTRCIHYRNKNLKNLNETTVTKSNNNNNNSSTITNITTININTSLHCPNAFDSDCPDCHHLLANNKNFDNNCYCNQKLVSPTS
ncbi:defective proboscis extension response 6 isoform 3-T5 [Cochliomyia hominivorax]